ncbi:unnamed protein product [marine sediment metagenome]|uniref:Protein kinase domain-containing protein n=1 Tax=marine sediment metagenome TaxID=412755 RepID=X0VCA3_9ZZZZ
MSEKPQRLGKYDILEEIGRGAFATVYRALDTTLEREVSVESLKALKDLMTLKRDTFSALSGSGEINSARLLTIRRIEEMWL